MSKPLFEERADATLERVKGTYAQRGTEYGDSWKHARWLALKATLRKFGYTIEDRHLVAITAAALVDVKYNRLEGGFKDDTLVDGIAYLALLAAEVAATDEGKTKPPAPIPIGYMDNQGSLGSKRWCGICACYRLFFSSKCQKCGTCVP